MKKPMVIAIAGVSGGGKTTIVTELQQKLPSAKALYFDEYDFKEAPEDFSKWLEEGANHNAWNIELLIEDLGHLLKEGTLNYIILDYPFAYENAQGAAYIDYAIFIDTPLDIAMARRILREKTYESPEKMENELKGYLSYGREAYLEMLKTIKPSSDLVINGALSIKEIVAQILGKVCIH
jgi:uridine kinase